MPKILGLASYTKGTLNLPREVREELKITTDKGKIVFYLDEHGKIFIEKA